MSSLGGRLWEREVVAYESLDHNGSKFFLIRILVTTETHAPMPTQCLEKVNWKSISRKNPVLTIEKFPFLVLARGMMLQHLIIHFSLHYLSSDRLREVKNKGKFRAFSSKSGRGRLREVVAYKRFQI